MYPFGQRFRRNTHYLPQPSYYSPNYFHPVAYAPYAYRQLPEVNPTLFMTSAQHMRILMKDAVTILDKMSDSKKFSLDLMSAAQESNQQKVDMLIKETGIRTTPTITYTPDGLKLRFVAKDQGADCCNLTITLRWT